MQTNLHLFLRIGIEILQHPASPTASQVWYWTPPARVASGSIYNHLRHGVAEAIIEGKTYVIDLDLRSYFDTVRHPIVLEKVARRVSDAEVLWLLRLIPKASGNRSVPQGGVISPWLSNLYLRHRSRPVRGWIEEINPILRGWVNYFAFGHSSRCFSFIRFWVEKKVRRQLARACERRGFGWKRWSSAWLYGTLGLFHEYRVSYEQRLA